ncbi:zinc-binding alcohol dehydrogenase family protein [Dyadobacter subterraneus]|uniref:NADP-dependent oxidoreductase n=1 Tax=Dyadobacter subterraneus TaxID=2773304 RepID=A0ABR9WEQ1_9BACT|nr:NADP-dependent oxidoreductase [Dyadobacter subterraneus]MBE9463978.1 NADP-dependent oxidoreductase [Dyadobacter subterraneus]
MQAIVLKDFGSVENFVIEDKFPIPKITENQILVKIKAAAFNPIDYQMRQGKTERKRMHSQILGREMSGIVVEIGEKVTKFKVGDAILAACGSMGSNGTYCEYIAIPETIAALKPKSLSFEQAAAIPTASITALQCFNRLKIKPEDSIFITGAAGGVGIVLVKILLAMGFKNIIVTAGNQQSIHQLLKKGLKENQIINYKNEDLQELILGANNQNFYDHCIDLVGAEMSEICAKVLITNGNYADVTALSTEIARENLFNKGATIINISNYAYMLAGNINYYGEKLTEFISLITSNIITPPEINIIGTLSRQTVKTAHQMLENNKTNGKKLIMKID